MRTSPRATPRRPTPVAGNLNLADVFFSPIGLVDQPSAPPLGSNRGVGDDVRLRYAEEDAARVHDVLTEIGDFPAHNMVLLRGADAGQSLRRLRDKFDAATPLGGVSAHAFDRGWGAQPVPIARGSGCLGSSMAAPRLGSFEVAAVRGSV